MPLSPGITPCSWEVWPCSRIVYLIVPDLSDFCYVLIDPRINFEGEA